MKTMKLVDLAKTAARMPVRTESRLILFSVTHKTMNWLKKAVCSTVHSWRNCSVSRTAVLLILWNLTRVMQSNLPSTACVPPVPLGRVIYLAANSTRLCWT